MQLSEEREAHSAAVRACVDLEKQAKEAAVAAAATSAERTLADALLRQQEAHVTVLRARETGLDASARSSLASELAAFLADMATEYSDASEAPLSYASIAATFTASSLSSQPPPFSLLTAVPPPPRRLLAAAASARRSSQSQPGSTGGPQGPGPQGPGPKIPLTPQ